MPNRAKLWGLLLITVAASALLAGLAYWRGDSSARQEPQRPAPVPLPAWLPDLVARVDGLPLRREAVREALAGLPAPTPEDLRQAVLRLIDRTLINQALAALEDAAPFADAEELLAHQVVIEPDEVEALWKSHRDVFYGDFLSLRRVVASTDEEARAIRARLSDSLRTGVGESPDSGAAWVGPGELDREIEQALRGVAPGQASEPIRAEVQVLVFQVLARKLAEETSFADWRPRLTRHLRAERWHRERPRWLRLRAACADLDVAPEMSLPSVAAAEAYFRTHPDVVAVVDGREITFAALERRLAQHRRMRPASHQHSPVSEDEVRAVLARMIESEVIRAEGEQRGLRVEAAEVQDRLRSLRSGFASDAELDGMLRANATSLAEWLETTRNGLLYLKTERAAEARLVVDPEELAEYWDQNKEALRQDRVRVTGLPFESEPDARDALAQLRAGRPFEALGQGVGASRAPMQAWLSRAQVSPEAWAELWATAPRAVVGPVRFREKVWLFRVDDRQEAGAQTAADHREAMEELVRHTRWLLTERVRWVASLLERSTIWNRFELTLKLGQRPPAGSEVLRGRAPAVVVVAAARTCPAGLCESVGGSGRGPVPIRFVLGRAAERVAQAWHLPTLPWAFALDARGVVVGECPGPLTDQILERLAQRLEAAPHEGHHAAF